MKESFQDLLLRSFDSNLSAEETERLEEALKNSEPLQREKEHLIQIRQMAASESVRFRPFFAERVMHRILSEKSRLEEDFSSSLQALFRPMMIAAVVLILAMVSFNALKKHVFISTALSSNDISLEEAFDPTAEW